MVMLPGLGSSTFSKVPNLAGFETSAGLVGKP